MTIYVGKWDLLPESWEGINGLYEKSEEEIKAEVEREEALETGCYYLGCYTPRQFEEEFNGDNFAELHGTNYWIKIF